jgi:Flp pilus assembly pilin Flp
MRRALLHFVRDESGAVSTAESLLLATLLIIASLVGLVAVRNAITQEFGDVGVALESLDQSYSFTVGTVTSQYVDPPTTLTDPVGGEPAGLSVTVPAKSEQ